MRMTNNKDLNCIAESAESVGIHVDEHTAISIPFIADVMRKMREQSNSDEDCISRKAVEEKKQVQEYESKRLIDELSKMPPMVIATAYLYAINYTLYGEDVTEKWLTAVKNAYALEKAYSKGYHDALQRQAESEE